jgi:hypothetical protein
VGHQTTEKQYPDAGLVHQKIWVWGLFFMNYTAAVDLKRFDRFANSGEV